MTSWKKQVFLMELRKLLTYRADFWANFIGQTFFSLALAYFLWKSIFDYTQSNVLNGMTLQQMIFYYLMAPLIFRIQQGQGIGSISKDIYEGSLTKYLLYPVHFFRYKELTFFANATFYFLQLVLILGTYHFLFPNSDTSAPSVLSFLIFTITIGLGTYLFFYIFALAELMAFWFDNTWSLGVLLRFITSFLGGALIPLSFFPETAQKILQYTPFPYLIDFPMKILVGHTSSLTIIQNTTILLCWIICFKLLAKKIWSKGQLNYSGIGM